MRSASFVTALLLGGLGCLGPRVAGAQEVSLNAFGQLVAVQSRPSFSIVGAGARAAGMGGAFTALADDASAASFNPAGLALLLQPEASVVFDEHARRDDHAPFRALEMDELESYSGSSSSFSSRGLNFASFTLPFTVAQRNLTFQLSLHRLVDFSFDSDRSFQESLPAEGPSADLRQTIDQTGDIHTLSVAAAYQVTPRMSLGLTASRWIGDWRFVTSTEETSLEDDEVTTVRFSQDNQWRGWNFTVGLLLRYRYLNVGAAYRSPFEGGYRVASGLETNFETPFEPASAADGTLSWPTSWTVGVAVKPMETWVLTADLAYFDWDDMVFRDLDPLGPHEVNFFDFKPPDESSVTSTMARRFGTEYTVFAGRHIIGLRGGYFFEPRPQLLGPSDEKTSNRGLSFGVGWKLGGVSVDLAYQRSTASSRILQFVNPEELASGLVEAQAEGRVDSSDERFVVGLLYQFGSHERFKDLVRFLFVGPKKRPAKPPPEPPATEEPGGQAPPSTAGDRR